MGRKFNQAEVFPKVARVIREEYWKDPRFVTHDEIVKALALTKPPAIQRIVTREGRGITSDMVAWFSQKITVGQSEWAPFQQEERQGERR